MTSATPLLPLASLAEDERLLVDAASAVARRAYAPYSSYFVGAAISTESGRIHVGCNVENGSYGATICAERSAIFAMVAAGDRRITKIAVFAPSEPLAMPCGMCRQVIVEFCDDAIVCVACAAGARRMSFRELLPEPFKLRRDP